MRPSIPYIQACFDDYNARFFRSELPPVPIRLSNAKGFLGKLTFTRRRTSLFGPYRNTDFVLRINTRIDLPEPVVQDTILHEMIHYYIAVRQLRDTATHGTLFRREMQRINAEGNRHITISHRLSPDEQQQSLVRKGRLVAHVFFRDGSIGIKVLPKQIPLLLDWQRRARRAFPIDHIDFYYTDHLAFAPFPASTALRIYSAHSLPADTFSQAHRLLITPDGVRLSLNPANPLRW
ncbi:MAG: SprT-like domain-containing protein [Paludibacteraceae bacterium]|nr:SprT-like domain-containing protein [Paludibacteraceae bacterium]